MNFRQGYVRLLSAAVAAGLFACCAMNAAAQTATLKGRFVYDGPAPTPEKINVTKDPEFCGKQNLVGQELVVGKDGGLANVAVWLFTKGVKPADDKAPAGAAVLDNKGCHFEPHVLVMRTGQPLQINNSDTVGHNTMGLPRSNQQFNVLIPASGNQQVANLNKPERLPFKVSCSIHPWMGGYVVLQDGPYAAVSGGDGTFSIANLPVGKELEFQAWQEKSGYVKDVNVAGKPETWNFGRFKMTLKPGDNDLGEIKVPAAAFKQ